MIDSSQHTMSTITCAAAPRVWHFSAIPLLLQLLLSTNNLTSRELKTRNFLYLFYPKTFVIAAHDLNARNSIPGIYAWI